MEARFIVVFVSFQYVTRTESRTVEFREGQERGSGVLYVGMFHKLRNQKFIIEIKCLWKYFKCLNFILQSKKLL